MCIRDSFFVFLNSTLFCVISTVLWSGATSIFDGFISFICNNLSFSGPASGQHQLCPSAEPWGQHPLGRRHNPQNLATKPSSSTGIKQLQRALKNKLYRIYRDICIYRALYNVSWEIYRSEKECPNNLSLIQKY